MPKKILISTLGRGVKLQEGDKRLATRQFGYNLTTYAFRKGKKPLKLYCELCAKFLVKKVVKPDKVYVVGTNESIWQIADEELGQNNYEKIIIPSGVSEKEHWEMVNAIIQKLDVQKDDMIYLDITHAFRSIPLLYFVVVGYLQEVVGAKFAGCYYGMYDTRTKENITEVIDLRLHVDFIFWLTAASVFVKTGDAMPLIEALARSKASQNSEIKVLLTLLRDLNRHLSITNTPKIINLLMQIIAYINSRGFKKTCEKLPAMKILIDYMDRSFKEIIPNQDLKKWQIQYNLAKWYYSCRRVAQAVIIMSELVITYIVEESKVSQDPFNRVIRGQVNKALKAISKNPELLDSKLLKEPLRTSLLELARLGNEIAQARNLVAHGGITPQLSLKEMERKIEENFSNLARLGELDISQLKEGDLKRLG